MSDSAFPPNSTNSFYAFPPNSTATFTQTSHDLFVLTGKDLLTIGGEDDGSRFLLLGQGNSVDIAATSGSTIYDLGHGSFVDFYDAILGNSNIYGFQFDSTGEIAVGTRGPSPSYLTNGTTGGTPLPSDGHGGSIFSGGLTSGSIDFRGDPHVAVSSVSPPSA